MPWGAIDMVLRFFVGCCARMNHSKRMLECWSITNKQNKEIFQIKKVLISFRSLISIFAWRTYLITVFEKVSGKVSYNFQGWFTMEVGDEPCTIPPSELQRFTCDMSTILFLCGLIIRFWMQFFIKTRFLLQSIHYRYSIMIFWLPIYR